jgi:transcriptional regulator with XRE-family HTH domain
VAVSGLNSDRIRQRREELGLSQRALERALGLAGNTLNKIEDTQRDHGELPFRVLVALAEALALHPSELFAHTNSTADGEPPCKLLAALLENEAPPLTSKEALAKGFGWTLDDTHDAIAAADEALQGSGLRLHVLPGVGIGVRADTTVLDEAERQRLARPDSATPA